MLTQDAKQQILNRALDALQKVLPEMLDGPIDGVPAPSINEVCEAVVISLGVMKGVADSLMITRAIPRHYDALMETARAEMVRMFVHAIQTAANVTPPVAPVTHAFDEHEHPDHEHHEQHDHGSDHGE